MFTLEMNDLHPRDRARLFWTEDTIIESDYTDCADGSVAYFAPAQWTPPTFYVHVVLCPGAQYSTFQLRALPEPEYHNKAWATTRRGLFFEGLKWLGVPLMKRSVEGISKNKYLEHDLDPDWRDATHRISGSWLKAVRCVAAALSVPVRIEMFSEQQ